MHRGWEAVVPAVRRLLCSIPQVLSLQMLLGRLAAVEWRSLAHIIPRGNRCRYQRAHTPARPPPLTHTHGRDVEGE